MFSFLKSDPKKKLQKQYEQLLKEAFELSKTNRTASDKKAAEAEEVAKQIEALG
jgi:hypothetical protein